MGTRIVEHWWLLTQHKGDDVPNLPIMQHHKSDTGAAAKGPRYPRGRACKVHRSSGWVM